MRRKSAKYFDMAEAAKRLGVTRSAIHLAISEGRLKAKKETYEVTHKIRGWRILESDLKKYQVNEARQKAGLKKTAPIA